MPVRPDETRADYIACVKSYFSDNLPGFIVERDGFYTGWWWVKLSNPEANIFVDFDGDIGGSFFVTLIVEGESFPLWKVFDLANSQSESTVENILAQLKIVRQVLLGRHG